MGRIIKECKGTLIAVILFEPVQLNEFNTLDGGNMAMYNDDEVKGKFEKAKGTVKDKVGEWTGNERLEAEGEAERAEGEVQDSWGKVKHGVSDAVDSAGDALSNLGKKINN